VRTVGKDGKAGESPAKAVHSAAAAIVALAMSRASVHLLTSWTEDLMKRQATPSVSFGTRLSVDADQLRRQLEARLNLTASKLLERSLFALKRELDAQAELAE
jgi:hypothetical protein